MTGRLLLVDDNEIVRALAVLALRNHGYSVVEAGTGDEALAHLSNSLTPFDLLITDLVMPAMNGYELAKHAAEASPGLRVLITSGYATPETLAPIAGSGEAAFLQKPYELSQLAGAVADLLAA